MGLKQKKLGFYRILSIIFFLFFVFVLTLPRMFDLNKGQKTDECIGNMKRIVEAAQKYVDDRGIEKSFTINDLVNGKYLETSPECPEENIGDKYNMILDFENQTVEVKCANEAKHPNHKLPPAELF